MTADEYADWEYDREKADYDDPDLTAHEDDEDPGDFDQED